jgi:predicted transglutaminase-like cysteine proteinase
MRMVGICRGRISRKTVPHAAPYMLLYAIMVPALLLAPLARAMDYPKLFGTSEIRSDRLTLFTHWTDMIERMRTTPEPFADACEDPAAKLCHLKEWDAFLDSVKALDQRTQLDRVNEFMNAFPYIDDIANWGRENRWETPLEFLARSGDCKDYAIAKYMSLRYLGWPIDQLRIVVLRDVNLNADRAVLAVYVGDEILILDNQIAQVTNADNIHHYRPYYSINEDYWWFHH